MKLHRSISGAGREHAWCRVGGDVEMKPLRLTDRQMWLVQNAAKAVPVKMRDEFLARLARHLLPEPSDAAVAAAINAQLDMLSLTINGE
jgi:hypothetical protein